MVNSQSGELDVVGSNRALIHLERRPAFVRAHFKEDDRCQVPCNPVSFDELEYFVEEREIPATFFKHKSKSYILVIEWSVSDYRTIVWHAEY